MAYKTMLRQLISKWGIMSIELQTAIDKDMGAIHEDGSVDYVDNSVDFEPDNGTVTAKVDQSTGEVIEAGDEDPTAGFFGN
jgi:recombination protein RecT